MRLEEYELMYKIESAYWWFLGKRWIMMKLLRDRFGEREGAAILDVGCGTGKNLEALAEAGDARGCDVSPEALDFCRRRGLDKVTLQADPHVLPFDSGSFDLVTALDVIEHVEDDSRMLAEIARVLKPSGAALLTVPAHPVLWTVHDEALRHRRRYSRRDLRLKMEAAGLRVDLLSGMDGLLLPLIVPVRFIRHRFAGRGEATSDFHLRLPSFLNALFLAVFKSEWPAIRMGLLPFGLSYMALACKPE